jgi:hypothetical protein
MNYSTHNIKRKLIAMAAVCAFSFGFGGAVLKGEIKFDHARVRSDVFAGMAGDTERLGQAMRTCESVLAGNARHAEALVWHGVGLYTQGVAALRSGKQQEAIELMGRAMQEMGQAVALEPDNIGVRAPRGALMLEASKRIGNPQEAKRVLAAGIADYRRILELQQGYFETIGTHPRGELLFGLAEGTGRLGDLDEAASLFDRIRVELPGTVYARRADKWSVNKSLPAAETQCVGCHVK